MTNDLIYHGGNAGSGAIGVETSPAVYLVYWGAEWAAGFKTADSDGTLYSSATLEDYLNSFFANVGGSPWAGVQTQYCRGVLPGATSCVGGTGFVTNPKHQLKGVWVDSTPVPSDIVTLGLAENLVDDPIAMEAQRASAHFGYYDRDLHRDDAAAGDRDRAARLLRLPRADDEHRRLRQPVPAPVRVHPLPEHGLARPRQRRLRHAQRQRGQRLVRQRRLRRLQHRRRSRVRGGGHRPGQLLRRPDGWNDAQTSENGDKCAWYHTQNITLAGHAYAVQPMWSNEAFDAGKDGCAVSR